MKPHVHSKEIHAFAEGYEIEYLSCIGEWLITNNPAWDKNVKYRIKDPYRELKEAAADPTKQIRLKGRDWYGDWYGVGEYALQPWSFNYPLECYEIRDKPAPKQKVKMWQWVFKDSTGRVYLGSKFFPDIPKHGIKRADWTMIEVEE